MIIKKYVGKTEEEALALAKKELGNGVVLMNTRSVRAGGLFSFLRAQRIEVTVALEDEGARARVVSPQTAPHAGARKAEGEAAQEKPPAKGRRQTIDIAVGPEQEKEAEAELSPMAGIARLANEGKLPPLKTGPDAPVLKEEGKTSSPQAKEIEDKLESLTSLLSGIDRMKTQQSQAGARPEPVTQEPAREEEKKSASQREEKQSAAPAAKPAEEASPKREESPREEADAEKQKEQTERTKSAPEDSASEEALSFIRLLYNTLLENEVDERYANELTDEVEKIAKPNMSLDYALANVYQKMVLKFGRSETIAPSAAGPKAEIFIGPTGVGKTTTIAKLASKLHLQDKKKVALLTVDTYRIAAAEQLRTYATIMETPFRVIYSVEEMKQAIEDFRDFDYIMVDTAGHSLHNEELRESISAFISAVAEDMDTDNFLVLSATTKYRDLIEITDAYAKMVDYRLIFTKMDETQATGNLYNIRLRTGAPMSYITNGQDVPDDIEVFNAQKIVKGLLGGRK